MGELAEIVQMPQSSVSRHLKALAETGWLGARSEGTANLYRMTNGELPESSRGLWEIAKKEIAGWPALSQDHRALFKAAA